MSLSTQQDLSRGRGWRAGLAAIGLAVFLIALLQSLLLRPSHQQVLGVLLLVGSLGAAFVCRSATRGKSTVSVFTIAAVNIAAELLWMISGWYPAWVIAQAGGFALALVAFSVAWAARRRKSIQGARRVGVVAARILGGLLAVVAVVLAAGAVTNSITPVPVTSALQSSLGGRNSFSPSGPAGEQTVLADGTVRTTDIEYGAQYPNSYLDVYIAKGKTNPGQPTVINVHGGGFILGDKQSGDPNTGGGEAGSRVTVDPYLNAGYNYVSINYALAPGARYPTPVRQVTEALKFLQTNAETYGLDMDDVILTGGSAGGQIVGQLANIQTNPDYAKQVGITPGLRTDPKAVLLDSAVLDLSRASSTETPLVSSDLLFGLASRAYFGTSEDVLHEADVTSHVTARFPPAFISDGNTGTFPDQARDLHEKLDQLGVRNQLNLYPKSEAVLGHGFMANPGPKTDDYLKLKFAFLTDVLR